MSEEVGIRYTAEGTAEAAAGVNAFADANANLTRESDGARVAVEELDTAHGEFSATAQAASNTAIQFMQRMQAAASAVQALSSVFGSSGDEAALIGRVTQSTVAFAQLGGILGPGGALVGGIVGALIPAWQAWQEAMAPVVPAQEALVVAIDHTSASLIRQGLAADAARISTTQFLQTLSTGGMREDLGVITDEITRLTDELEGLENTYANRDRRMAIGARVEVLQGHVETFQRAIAGSTDTTPSGGGSRTPRRDAEADAFGEAIGFASGVDSRSVDPGRNGMGRAGSGGTRGGQRSDRGGAEHVTEQMVAERQLRQIQIDRLTAQRALEDKAHDERMRQQREFTASIQDEMDALNSAGEKLGGVFSNAFQAAIQGQADFGQAMQDGIKQVLLQYGTQMVAEGVGALLTGVGNVIFNPPAAAAKLAEGAGKIALGVGLGAAGAAIPAGASAGGGRPAEAPRGAANGSGSGNAPAPITVILNAPTVMGGTHSEVGRALGASAAAAQRRYGGRRMAA